MSEIGPYLILGLKIVGWFIGYLLTALVVLVIGTGIDTWCTDKLEEKGFGLVYVLGHIITGFAFLYALPLVILITLTQQPIDVGLSDDDINFFI